MGYTHASARIYKRFCPRPSAATFAQSSDATTEEERLSILEQVRKDMRQKSIYRKLQFDIAARQPPFVEGDQVLTRVQKVKKGQNKKIVPTFRPDNQGKPFTVLMPHKGYCQLLDTSSNKYFFQNNNHILKVKQGKLQPLPATVPFVHDPKIFIPYTGRVPVPDTREHKIDFD